MSISGAAAVVSPDPPPSYNRLQELKSFDESKAGVKGLVDAGIGKIPQMFIRPPNELAGENPVSDSTISIPIIDLSESNGDDRAAVVESVRLAAEKLGFFQVVNHGIPMWVLDNMLKGVIGFHELEWEVKKRFYTRDAERKVKFGSNFDLYESRYANWRDTLFCVMGPEPLDPLELPGVCRYSLTLPI